MYACIFWADILSSSMSSLKAEAEARIEAEKAVEGARKKQQGDQALS